MLPNSVRLTLIVVVAYMIISCIYLVLITNENAHLRETNSSLRRQNHQMSQTLSHPCL